MTQPTDPQKPSIHTDEDWKSQARREKEKLVEEEQQAKKETPVSDVAAATAATAAAAAGQTAAAQAAGAQSREMPPADFLTLVNSLVMQTLLAFGLFPDKKGQHPEPQLDLAKFHIDTLAMLEEKTKNNLSDEEKRTLALALHDLRMRYVELAS